MRTMYDSTTAADCPAGSQLVAGYVDGRYKWSDADWALHAGKVLVRIAVDPNTHDGHVLDVETGAAGPIDVPFWLNHRRAAGMDPSVYVNLSNVDAVLAACSALPDCLPPHLWLAHYDNDPTIPMPYYAKQYADEALTGGHYDTSAVLDFWPGVDGGAMVSQADFDAYKVALQKELDDNYVRKDAPVAPHTHSATATAPSVTIT